MKKKRSLLQKINGLIRQARVPIYLHHFGPKKFTSIQHVKCWLLKEKLKCSWDDFIEEHARYYHVEKIPEVSTLKKFVKRMPFWLKNLIISLSTNIKEADYGAIDSTGLGRTSASPYFTKRIDRDTPLKACLKLSLYTTKNTILAFRLRAKWRGDTLDVPYLLNHAPLLAETNCLDKGYDAEWVHGEFRQRGVYSIIPARKGCRRGSCRKQMRDCFDVVQFWQRNCGEWNNSSFKRRFGSFVRSFTFRTQHSEVAARIILHNMKAILLRLFHDCPSDKLVYYSFLDFLFCISHKNEQ